MSYHHTYHLPTIITYCSNNYGPNQYPEKLIPTMIQKKINNEPLTLYGTGENIRDWIYVEDHINAIELVFNKGHIGGKYCIGAEQELSNLEITKKICAIMDGKLDNYNSRIQYVPDRLGHDYRYAINNKKIKSELGWSPKVSLDVGLNKTIEWYINNKEWLDMVRKKEI